MDTFDYKPELDRRHGQPFDPGGHVEAPTSAPGNLMKSPFPFRQHGECGPLGQQRLSRDLAACVDDMAFLMALASKTNVHGPASYMMNYGFLMPGFPVPGGVAVVRPGLAGRQPADLRRACPTPRACPTTPRGTSRRDSCRSRIRGRSSRPARPGRSPTCSRPPRPASSPPESQRDGLGVLERLNRRHAAANEGDSRLESRIAAYELAARMQQSAPEALDLGGETPATRALVRTRRSRDRRLRPAMPAGSPAAGARACGSCRSGAARAGAKNNWDNHSDIPERAAAIARTVDRPIAGTAARPQGPGPARRHPGRLEHRVRPPAVHPGRHRPRPQRRHVGRLAGRRRYQGGHPPTARATPGPGRPPPGRPTATTCTPRSSTCWGSTTRDSPSATTASTAG